MFPKATTHRQDGIVLGEKGRVLLPVSQRRARQVPGNLAEIGLHDLFDGLRGFRFFGENHLADHRVHIGVGELHAHGEAAFQPPQIAGPGHGGLTGADEQQTAAKVLAAGFHEFLHLVGASAVSADVLLHLVQHDQGQRELAVLGQGLAHGLEHLVAGHVVPVGIEVVQGLHTGGGRGEQVGPGLRQRLVQTCGHIEVVQLLAPVQAALFHAGARLLINALLVEPHHETGDGILFGQSGGFEQNAQKRQAHAALRACAQCARNGVQAAVALGPDAELPQGVPDFLRQTGDAPGGGPVRKNRVVPEGAQHLDEMGLARTEKTADPHPGLLRLVNVFQVGFENPGHALAVFAFADKGFQFVAQHFQGLTGPVVVDVGHALVDEFAGRRIFQVDLAVFHIQKSLSAVMGTAR